MFFFSSILETLYGMKEQVLLLCYEILDVKFLKRNIDKVLSWI